MDTYDKVKELVNLGFWVRCDDGVSKKPEMFFAEYDNKLIGYSCNFNREDFKKWGYKITKIIPRKPKILTAGTKVRRAEEFWKYAEDRASEKLETAGDRAYEIRLVNSELAIYWVRKPDKRTYHNFPAWCVIPVYEREEKENVMSKIKTIQEKIDDLQREAEELKNRAKEL